MKFVVASKEDFFAFQFWRRLKSQFCQISCKYDLLQEKEILMRSNLIWLQVCCNFHQQEACNKKIKYIFLPLNINMAKQQIVMKFECLLLAGEVWGYRATCQGRNLRHGLGIWNFHRLFVQCSILNKHFDIAGLYWKVWQCELVGWRSGRYKKREGNWGSVTTGLLGLANNWPSSL